jgi:hypothetical protein
MRKGFYKRSFSLLGVLVLLFLTLPKPVSGCEICKFNFFFGYSPCQPVASEETGSTICIDSWEPVTQFFSCEESGTFCSWVNGGGGGNPPGGGGGGGSNICITPRFCPAECFSCSPYGV